MAWRGFQYEIEEVIKCLNENKIESPVLPHKISMDVVKIMDAVRSSSISGTPITNKVYKRGSRKKFG